MLDISELPNCPTAAALEEDFFIIALKYLGSKCRLRKFCSAVLGLLVFFVGQADEAVELAILYLERLCSSISR